MFVKDFVVTNGTELHVFLFILVVVGSKRLLWVEFFSG